MRDDTIGEIEDLRRRNLHVFRVDIAGMGKHEVLFQGVTRAEAESRLREWISREPFVTAEE